MPEAGPRTRAPIPYGLIALVFVPATVAYCGFYARARASASPTRRRWC
jgi:hypothetical protein